MLLIVSPILAGADEFYPFGMISIPPDRVRKPLLKGNTRMPADFAFYFRAINGIAPVMTGTVGDIADQTFRFADRLEQSMDAEAGDFIFVPRQLVHQEINSSDRETVTSVVARAGENIVVNVNILEADVT